MALTKTNIKTIKLALCLARKWEETVLASWGNCNDSNAKQIKKEANANIERFKKLLFKLTNSF